MQVHQLPGASFDCNQFLLLDEGDALVVDAGTGMASERTLAAIEEGLDGAESARIYLTHWHHDHTGGGPALARGLGAELLMPESEAHAVREGRSDLTLGTMFGLEQEAHPVTGVEPGEVLEVGSVELKILHTPGHTAGHTSLWHAPSRTLFAGDSVFSHGSFGRVDLPTGSPDEMLETLERLAGLGIETLYPGHLEAVEAGAGKHVEMALSNARGML